MEFRGLQKLSMVDYPGKLAAVVFTGGCSLRCPFCHNAPLVLRSESEPRLTEQEVLDFLSRRRGLLDGVVLSGGEPLLRPGAAEFLKKVRGLGFAVKLDTNGCFPEALAAILEAGLADYVAMDVKNRSEKYPETVGLPDFDVTPVRESARLLMEGGTDYEFRTTVVRELHQEEDLIAVGQWLRGAKRYVLQAFADSGDLVGTGCTGWDEDTLRRFAQAVEPYFGAVSLRGVE